MIIYTLCDDKAISLIMIVYFCLFFRTHQPPPQIARNVFSIKIVNVSLRMGKAIIHKIDIYTIFETYKNGKKKGFYLTIKFSLQFLQQHVLDFW